MKKHTLDGNHYSCLKFTFNGKFYSCLIKTTDSEVDLTTVTVLHILSGKEARAIFLSVDPAERGPEKYEEIYLKMEDLKRIFGSVALQQSLKATGLSYTNISLRMDISRRVVWNNCNGIRGCILWEERRNKTQLLSIAKFIICVTGGTDETD